MTDSQCLDCGTRPASDGDFLCASCREADEQMQWEHDRSEDACRSRDYADLLSEYHNVGAF